MDRMTRDVIEMPVNALAGALSLFLAAATGGLSLAAYGAFIIAEQATDAAVETATKNARKNAAYGDNENSAIANEFKHGFPRQIDYYITKRDNERSKQDPTGPRNPLGSGLVVGGNFKSISATEGGIQMLDPSSGGFTRSQPKRLGVKNYTGSVSEYITQIQSYQKGTYPEIDVQMLSLQRQVNSLTRAVQNAGFSRNGGADNWKSRRNESAFTYYNPDADYYNMFDIGDEDNRYEILTQMMRMYPMYMLEQVDRRLQQSRSTGAEMPSDMTMNGLFLYGMRTLNTQKETGIGDVDAYNKWREKVERVLHVSRGSEESVSAYIERVNTIIQRNKNIRQTQEGNRLNDFWGETLNQERAAQAYAANKTLDERDLYYGSRTGDEETVANQRMQQQRQEEVDAQRRQDSLVTNRMSDQNELYGGKNSALLSNKRLRVE
jgi:hypothetical protein